MTLLAFHTIFYKLIPGEKRKALSLNQQIYQLSQLNMLLLDDIGTLQTKKFYTIAKTDALAVPKNASNKTLRKLLKTKSKQSCNGKHCQNHLLSSNSALFKLTLNKKANACELRMLMIQKVTVR